MTEESRTNLTDRVQQTDVDWNEIREDGGIGVARHPEYKDPILEFGNEAEEFKVLNEEFGGTTLFGTFESDSYQKHVDMKYKEMLIDMLPDGEKHKLDSDPTIIFDGSVGEYFMFEKTLFGGGIKERVFDIASYIGRRIAYR